MSLKCHAIKLKGIGGMVIFNLLRKAYCQVRQSCSFSLKTVRVYIGEMLTYVWLK